MSVDPRLYPGLKDLSQDYMLQHWLNDHERKGGYLASSYVNWDILHSPMYEIVRMLEQFRSLPFEQILEFHDSEVTNNGMQDRNVMEDVSKIFYLTECIQYEELKFYPQILHEPWFNRYRVHPGSGRLIALWLCGFESIKCIYTHFNEPAFIPPGDCFKISNKYEAYKEFQIMAGVGFSGRPTKLGIETYSAFPKDENDCVRTHHYDHEWQWKHITTDTDWKFMRFSEGDDFLDHKSSWRSYVIDAWEDLRNDHIQIGSCQFNFEKDKVVDIIRNLGSRSTRHVLTA